MFTYCKIACKIMKRITKDKTAVYVGSNKQNSIQHSNLTTIKSEPVCLDETVKSKVIVKNTNKREHVNIKEIAPVNIIKKECLGSEANHSIPNAEPVDIKDSEALKTFKNVCPDKTTEFKVIVKKTNKREHIKIEEIVPVKIKKECLDSEAKAKLVDIKKEDIKSKFPLHWESVLKNLREMRKDANAPVDSMGCDQCMDENSNEKDKRYQALLSLMLSSQTKDQITHAAMQKLISHGCNVENILNTSNEKLGELIYPVGFWKTKVKYIKKSTEMIRDLYGGDIPKTVQELCKLNGVGPKMAHLCMKTAWGEVTGIGVDTHVHRICNRMGWVNSKQPENTRKQLEDWLPNELWSEVNHLLVGFGQQVCQPIRPQCATCLNYQICPFGIKQLKMDEGKLKSIKKIK